MAWVLAAEPELILYDEVTSALDVSVQATRLGLLIDLRAVRETTYIFASHDLAVVRALADRMAVLYLGRISEISPIIRFYISPFQPL